VTSLTGVDNSYAKESMKDVVRFEAALAMVKYFIRHSRHSNCTDQPTVERRDAKRRESLVEVEQIFTLMFLCFCVANSW
jgi:hypothetical protein